MRRICPFGKNSEILWRRWHTLCWLGRHLGLCGHADSVLPNWVADLVHLRSFTPVFVTCPLMALLDLLAVVFGSLEIFSFLTFSGGDFSGWESLFGFSRFWQIPFFFVGTMPFWTMSPFFTFSLEGNLPFWRIRPFFSDSQFGFSNAGMMPFSGMMPFWSQRLRLDGSCISRLLSGVEGARARREPIGELSFSVPTVEVMLSGMAREAQPNHGWFRHSRAVGRCL